MRLNTLHAQLSTDERRALAGKAGITLDYLWQIATRWRSKRASLRLIEKLAQADSRLTLAEMLAEFTEPAPVVDAGRATPTCATIRPPCGVAEPAEAGHAG